MPFVFRIKPKITENPKPTKQAVQTQIKHDEQVQMDIERAEE